MDSASNYCLLALNFLDLISSRQQYSMNGFSTQHSSSALENISNPHSIYYNQRFRTLVFSFYSTSVQKSVILLTSMISNNVNWLHTPFLYNLTLMLVENVIFVHLYRIITFLNCFSNSFKMLSTGAIIQDTNVGTPRRNYPNVTKICDTYV